MAARHKPWKHLDMGIVVTILFIAANVLLFRHRRLTLAGFFIWVLLLALLLLLAI
jgi:hypothetical protein